MLAVQAAVPAAAKRGGFRMFSSRRYGGLNTVVVFACLAAAGTAA